MCDWGSEKDRFLLRREELSQRQMRRVQDQTENTLTQYVLYIGSNRCKIVVLCEDQNRTGFQDSGFKSSDDKECSGLSFRSERISSINGFFSDNSSPGLQVLFYMACCYFYLYFEFKAGMVLLVPRSSFSCEHQQSSMIVCFCRQMM